MLVASTLVEGITLASRWSGKFVSAFIVRSKGDELAFFNMSVEGPERQVHFPLQAYLLLKKEKKGSKLALSGTLAVWYLILTPMCQCLSVQGDELVQAKEQAF